MQTRIQSMIETAANVAIGYVIAQESLGLCKGSVSRVCNGKQAHTHGYIFKYLEDEKQS